MEKIEEREEGIRRERGREGVKEEEKGIEWGKGNKEGTRTLEQGRGTYPCAVRGVADKAHTAVTAIANASHNDAHIISAAGQKVLVFTALPHERRSGAAAHLPANCLDVWTLLALRRQRDPPAYARGSC